MEFQIKLFLQSLKSLPERAGLLEIVDDVSSYISCHSSLFLQQPMTVTFVDYDH